MDALEITLRELWRSGRDGLPIEAAVNAAKHNILTHDLCLCKICGGTKQVPEHTNGGKCPCSAKPKIQGDMKHSKGSLHERT